MNRNQKQKSKKYHHNHKTSVNISDSQQKEDKNYDKNVFLVLTKYELKELLNKSDFFKTYKVIYKENKIVYFAKISTVKYNKFTKDELINIYGIASGMSHLHSKNIVHKD